MIDKDFLGKIIQGTGENKTKVTFSTSSTKSSKNKCKRLSLSHSVPTTGSEYVIIMRTGRTSTCHDFRQGQKGLAF